METREADIAIIGAGPVGLSAIFQCGMMGMSCVVIDALDHIGGQCTALYPQKPIYDIPAYPSIYAADLIAKLEEQARSFTPQYLLGQQVTSLEDGFVMETSCGNIVKAKAVIIAGGAGAFGPNRPPLEGIISYEGAGNVAYMVQNKERYRGKKIVIAGGGDSAVDWAIELYDIARHIYVVHRRAKFRAAPEACNRMEELATMKKLDLVTPYQLSAIKGDGDTINHIEVKDLDGNVKALEADVLLAFFGLSMELGPIADWGLGLHNKHISVTPPSYMTSKEGVFAIGDICHYEGKLKLISCGFAEAAHAAHAAYKTVHPDKAYHFEYSTTKGVPGA